MSEVALRAMFLLLTTAEPAAVNAGSASYYYLRPPHEDPREVFTCAVDAHHIKIFFFSFLVSVPRKAGHDF